MNIRLSASHIDVVTEKVKGVVAEAQVPVLGLQTRVSEVGKHASKG